MSVAIPKRAVNAERRRRMGGNMVGVLVVLGGLAAGCVTPSRPALDDSSALRAWREDASDATTVADSKTNAVETGSWWRRWTLGGRTASKSQPPLLPDQYVVRVGPFRVHSGRPLPPDSPEALALATLPARIASTLGVAPEPHATATVIYLLDNHARFTHFLRHHHPDLPDRRAFFIAEGPRRRVIYAFWGDRLAEDLRHEGTHALFHAAGFDLPLWLDEGLAECFEVPEGPRAPALDHLARLLAAHERGWTPDLKRLERLSEIETMSLRDYSESWAWVHWLIDPDPSDQFSAPHPALMTHLAEFLRDPERRARALGDSSDPATATALVPTEAVSLLSPRLETAPLPTNNPAQPESAAPRDAQARLASFATSSEGDPNRGGSNPNSASSDSRMNTPFGSIEQGLVDHLKRLSQTGASRSVSPHSSRSRGLTMNPRLSPTTLPGLSSLADAPPHSLPPMPSASRGSAP